MKPSLLSNRVEQQGRKTINVASVHIHYSDQLGHLLVSEGPTLSSSGSDTDTRLPCDQTSQF